MFDFFFNIIEQSLVFLPFAIGVFISYGILNKADLTVDGSFVLGGGLFAKLLLLGLSPAFAMVCAAGAGALAGIFTSLLQYRDRISSLIAGILALFILQSVNFITMGRPNLSILGYPTILSTLDTAFSPDLGKLIILIGLSLSLLVVILLFLQTRFGIMLRAFGCNAKLVSLLGNRAEIYRILGLSLSNALVAYSGALTVQSNGYADIGMGTGLVLIGIATVLLGQQMEHYFQSTKISSRVIFCFCGVIIYFSVVNYLASFGLNPIYLKMFIGLTLAMTLVLQVNKKQFLGSVQ